MKRIITLVAIFCLLAAPAFAAWSIQPQTLFSSQDQLVIQLTCISDGSAATYTVEDTTGFYWYTIEVFPGTLGAAWDIAVTDSVSGAGYLAKTALSQTADEIVIGSETTGQYPLVSGDLKLSLDPDGDLTATNDLVIILKLAK